MIPTLSPAQLRDIETAIDLRAREERLRVAGRRAELATGGHTEAAEHFRRAQGLRVLRMRLLERAGLI